MRWRSYVSPKTVVKPVFPLTIGGNKDHRYFITAAGIPFRLQIEGVWPIAAQCSNAEIRAYLDDRLDKGFTGIQFMAICHLFTSQSPKWKNVDGDSPFATMSVGSVDFSQKLVTSYWARVEYLVSEAKKRNMVCIIAPGYAGYNGEDGPTAEGWHGEISSDTDAHLQTYGTNIANLLDGYGNVIWLAGGDYSNPAFNVKQWNIFIGIRSVNPSALIAGHAGRTIEAYTEWNSFAGFNVNTIYTDGTEYGYAETAYSRVMPFFLTEGWYEGFGGWTAHNVRTQLYVPILSGGCGVVYGDAAGFSFGDPDYGGSQSVATVLSTKLNSTGVTQAKYAARLFSEYSWHLLVPKTDNGFVTTPLGTGAARIVPALSSDGNFAMIWTPNVNYTVNMASLAPISVRGRWYDATTGNYSIASGSPFANTGTQAFTAPANDSVLVLDAA